MNDIQADEVVEDINKLVEEKTGLKDVIPTNGLTPDSRLVLVNAIYFKGEWQKKFAAADTKPQTFYINSNKTKEVKSLFFINTNAYTYYNFPMHWCILNAKLNQATSTSIF